jgi:MOSC domain-containing protein
METVGRVLELWRHPVKSMKGERIDASDVSERGLAGDRAYALFDVETGKVVSAKRPRFWGRMLEFRPRFESEPTADSALPAVRITLPDGSDVSSADPDIEQRLSDALGRKVSLSAGSDDYPALEEVWIEEKNAEPYGPVIGSEGNDRLIEIPASMGAPPGTFFDYSAIHIVTTGTLGRLADAHAAGRFDPRRFRPNMVVEVPEREFVENAWVGRYLSVGDVRLEVLVPTPRCVMTTLPQGDLPKDTGILRTAATTNPLPFGPFERQPCVGVYAEVLTGGTIRVGDDVRID